ncbi:FAD-dependent monooxygenase [Dyella mobilis]|uniref:FAD-dependent monooxygenase n=1 Tax=Dyella mobilis TaxID=1849582 RepID=A0ABS2KJB7_9GAMM|nr:FAD-dependent monooxygenase [Dyella mobilis]MBM7131257.1 FAD-dependent monooxygenase [Dyella mobilis]GLQ98805.1 hypothetical protein GCM10007863_32250 [Dyella mobilis]
MKVLISGAGVAGPALAFWLNHAGFQVTLVEQADHLRSGGQAVDIRGAALEVVERMGIGAKVAQARTRMKGMTVFDGNGTEIHRSTSMVLTSGRLDSGDIELLREDLARILYEHTRDKVEYVFADKIRAIDEQPDGMHVRFERSAPRVFDLIIGADGLHSNVRSLAFGPEEPYLTSLKMQIAIFSTDNFLGLDNWQIWLRDSQAGYGVYPVRNNRELRVTLGFGEGDIEQGPLDISSQKRRVAARLSHLGGETPRLLEAMWHADDFYTEVAAQIQMPHWTKGRIALVGDAAYCASPLSGQGTSLALVGAFVLANELAKQPMNYREAFARYEERMRPFVKQNQALATEKPGEPASAASIDAAKSAIELPAVFP